MLNLCEVLKGSVMVNVIAIFTVLLYKELYTFGVSR